MGKVLKAMAIAGSLALAAGTGASGVLAQEDDAGMVEPAETVSAETLAEAILAEVLAGLELPSSGGLEINVPTASPELTAENVPTIGESGGDINVGGSSGGQIMVGGSMGGGVTMGGGAMPAPPAEAPAPEAPPAPMSGGTSMTGPGY